MKLSVDSMASEAFKVSIELTEEEKTNFSESLVTFSLCLTRLLGELLQDSCETVREAQTLASVVCEMQEDMINDYIEKVFHDVKESREEAKMYGYMEEMFEAFLDSCGLSEEDFLVRYRNSETLLIKPTLIGNDIRVMLTNGRVADALVEFPVSLMDEDAETYHRQLCMAYMAAIVAGDVIFEEDHNPIRDLNAGPECDGGLSLAIQSLIS